MLAETSGMLKKTQHGGGGGGGRRGEYLQKLANNWHSSGKFIVCLQQPSALAEPEHGTSDNELAAHTGAHIPPLPREGPDPRPRISLPRAATPPAPPRSFQRGFCHR